MGAKKRIQECRYKGENQEREEASYGELEPAAKSEFYNFSQGCWQNINGEEAKRTKNKSHLANQLIENKRNLSKSMDEEDLRDSKSLRVLVNLSSACRSSGTSA